MDFNQLIKQHTKPMVQWTFTRVKDKELAKDIVQDTFLAGYNKQHTFKGESQPKTWLYAILNRKIADHFRGQKRKMKAGEVINSNFDDHESWLNPNAVMDWQSPDDSLNKNEMFLQTLEQCLEKLPKKYKTCIDGKYYKQQKSEFICKELNITSTNYWQIIRRAKLKIKDCLDENWFRNDE